MIEKHFGRSGAVFVLLPFVFLTLFSCAWAQPARERGPLVGGPCQYKSYPGQATILSVTKSQTGDQQGITRFDVIFSFIPQGKIEESFARVEGKTFHLYGKNFQYPDQKYLKTHDIHVGKVLDGSLQVIMSGTCTPVLFDFPALQQE